MIYEKIFSGQKRNTGGNKNVEGHCHRPRYKNEQVEKHKPVNVRKFVKCKKLTVSHSLDTCHLTMIHHHHH